MDEALASAIRHAKKTFTKPGLADQAINLQQAMYNNEMMGVTGFERLRDLLKEEMEYQFEQEIKDYPVVVKIPAVRFKVDSGLSSPSPLFEEIESWLLANVPVGEYIAFPTNASGKYKDCIFNVYFKHPSWATYFKVSYL